MSYKVRFRDIQSPTSKRRVNAAGVNFVNGEISEVNDLNKLRIILKRKDMVLVDERENNLANLKAKPTPKPEAKTPTKTEAKTPTKTEK